MRGVWKSLIKTRSFVKGARALVIKQRQTIIDANVDVQIQLLEAWKVDVREREHAHIEASKTLGDMHTKLMTPQLVLSAVTSTLAANNLQAPPGAPIATLTVLVAIICTVLSAITNFVEFNVAAERHSVAAKRYGTLYRHLGSVNTRDADDLELHVEMTSLELDHIADLAPTL